jgi:hypothetical protein
MSSRLQQIVGIVAALTTTLAGRGAPRPARAAEPATHHDHVIAVAGSSDYVAYLQYDGPTVWPPVQHLRRPLYVIGASGPPTLLTTVPYYTRFWMNGSMLVTLSTGNDVDNDNGQLLKWWNLATKSSGDMLYGYDQSPIATPRGATPDGWLNILDSTPPARPGGVYTYKLDRVTTDGTTTSLGSPFPDGALYYPSSGQRGFVAVSTCVIVDEECVDGDGAIKWMTYEDPRARTSLLGKDPERVESCGVPDEMYVACWTEDYDQPRRTGAMRLLPLDGSQPTTTRSHCPFTIPAVRGDTALWIGASANGCATAGHLVELKANGETNQSRRAFDDEQDAIPGFGGVIVCSRSDRALELMTRANSTPRVIYRTP